MYVSSFQGDLQSSMAELEVHISGLDVSFTLFLASARL